MKKIFVIFGLMLAGAASSYAIDQVTLTTGELLEGKVLADVPNRHVDIQLLNGEKRRFPKSQVLTVERDVPSNKDRDMFAADRRIFFGPQAGGLVNTGSGNNDLHFAWGAKLGFNAANLGGSLFSPAISFRHTQISATSILGSGTNSVNLINAEFLFRRISNSGFYIGPQIGLGLQSVNVTLTGFGSDSQTDTSFLAGAVIGWDFQFSDSFSIGPDVHYDHFFSGGGNTFSFALSALFHFE